MAVEQDGIDVSFPSAGDLSAGQYGFVVVQDDGQVAIGAGNGSSIIGVLQNKPAAENRGAVVRIAGISKFKSGSDAAIDERDRLTSTANGMGTVTTTATHHVGGVAVTAIAGTAQIGEIIVLPGAFGA